MGLVSGLGAAVICLGITLSPYHSQENGYTICVVSLDSHRQYLSSVQGSWSVRLVVLFVLGSGSEYNCLYFHLDEHSRDLQSANLAGYIHDNTRGEPGDTGHNSLR